MSSTCSLPTALRHTVLFLSLAAMAAFSAAASAKEPSLGVQTNTPATERRGSTPAYTFGSVDGSGFAIEGETWTFDHGGSDPLEGWAEIDRTAQSGTYFRQITSSNWDPENTVPAPVLSGLGSAWLGASTTEANALCWTSGLGYGDHWCQRLESPSVAYDGSSNVSLSWLHFNDTELDFDYTYVILRTLPSETETILREYTGQIGLAPDHPSSIPVGSPDSDLLTTADFQGDTSFQIVFEFRSDSGWSDEDGDNPTEYGPCGFDDVVIDGSSYGFEADLQGWSTDVCGEIGTFIGAAPIENYFIEDPSSCDLNGQVLGFHDTNLEHPVGQSTIAFSNPVDLANDVNEDPESALTVSAVWDQYSDMPFANGVFFRPGWFYYPVICPTTGQPIWSDRVGFEGYRWEPDSPVCRNDLSNAPAAATAAEQVRFAYEIFASCDAFAIPPETCTQITNFSPVLDNIQIQVDVREPVSNTLEFFQVDWLSDVDSPVVDSEIGDVTFRIDPGTPPGHLNVMLSDVGGVFEDWAVHNLPIPNVSPSAEPLTVRFFIDLEAIGVTRGTPLTSLRYSATVDGVSLEEAPADPTYGTAPVSDSEFDASGAVDSTEVDAAGLNLSRLWPDGPPHPPVIDMSDERYGKVPNIDEARNDCGPGSVTRNILYLASVDPCVQLDPDIDTGPEMLSKLRDYTGTDDGDAITRKQLLRSKTELSRRHPGLNMYTKFMASTARVTGGDYKGPGKGLALRAGGNAAPDWDWVKSEIDKGEVVEVFVNWLKPNGQRSTTGHIMSITNYWKAGTVKGVYIQHDEGQGTNDGKNEYRQLRWIDNGDGTSKFSHMRNNEIDMVVSQSPQCKAMADSSTCTVQWDTVNPAYSAKPELKIKPGKTGRFEGWTTTTDKAPHPKYDQFTWTNTTGTTKKWKLCVPLDGRINGQNCKLDRDVSPATGGGGESASDLEVMGVVGSSGNWSLETWVDPPVELIRIPMISAANETATVYAVVDLYTYQVQNPLGPAGGDWTFDTALGALGIDIVNGVPTGLDGIWFATTPFVFDPSGTLPFVPEGGASSWLNRTDFEASHGALSIQQEYLIGEEDTTGPIDLPIALRGLVVEPNPVFAESSVKWQLARRSTVELSVYDVGGRRVTTLLRGTYEAGPHEFRWDAESLSRLSPGVYFVQLRTDEGRETARISVIR